MVADEDRGNNVPTKNTLLSVLVHRAVGMPFQRAQTLGQGQWDIASMAAEIKSAASQLKIAFEMPQEEIEEDWSIATLLVDAGGPWFNASVGEFLEITQAGEGRTVADAEENRRFVLENLFPATVAVADFLQDKAAKDRWRSFWAEVTLLTGPGYARPSVLKVDQIAFLGRRNCCLIELKVTAGLTTRLQEASGELR